MRGNYGLVKWDVALGGLVIAKGEAASIQEAKKCIEAAKRRVWQRATSQP